MTENWFEDPTAPILPGELWDVCWVCFRRVKLTRKDALIIRKMLADGKAPVVECGRHSK